LPKDAQKQDSSMAEPIITARSLTRKFGDFTAIHMPTGPFRPATGEVFMALH